MKRNRINSAVLFIDIMTASAFTNRHPLLRILRCNSLDFIKDLFLIELPKVVIILLLAKHLLSSYGLEPDWLRLQQADTDTELVRMGVAAVEANDYRKGFELFGKINSLDYASSVKVFRALTTLIKQDRKYFLHLSGTVLRKINDTESVLNASGYEMLLIFTTILYFNSYALSKGNYDKAIADSKALLTFLEVNRNLEERMSDFMIEAILILFLNFEQPNAVLAVFEEFPAFKDKFKPLYYATLLILNKTEESIKMGPEIRTKANEIVEAVRMFRLPGTHAGQDS